MRILQLCKKFPYPVKDGESLAISNLSKAFSELGCTVDLLAMNTKKHFFDDQNQTHQLHQYRHTWLSEVDNQIYPLAALRNLFSSQSYHIERFIAPTFEQQLVQVLKEHTYDVIQLETVYLAPYIPVIRKYSSAMIAMRAHNVEHEIWERITQHTSSFVKRAYLAYLSRKLKRYELAQLGAFDFLVAISHRDQEKFRAYGYNGPVEVVPIGVDMAQYEPVTGLAPDQTPSLSFIGSLDWIPNQEGLLWFIREAWPQIRESYPGIEMEVAGRNMPDWLKEMKVAGIRMLGEVPAAQPFINKHPVMIVPLLSGSGMRAKILEGMALGKTVITTSVGLEGIQAQDRKHVLVADTPEAFTEAVSFCMEQPVQIRKIGQAARALVEQEYDNLSVARRLVDAYQAQMIPIS
jgi:glycosyltransferase involved in cell wall biosynthesis